MKDIFTWYVTDRFKAYMEVYRLPVYMLQVIVGIEYILFWYIFIDEA